MMGSAGFRPGRVYYDGQFGARPRRLSGPFFPVLKPYLRRLLDADGIPIASTRGVVPRLLLQPVTLTAFFTRR